MQYNRPSVFPNVPILLIGEIALCFSFFTIGDIGCNTPSEGGVSGPPLKGIGPIVVFIELYQVSFGCLVTVSVELFWVSFESVS